MKYSANIYARALVAALDDRPEEAAKIKDRFLAVLKKAGDSRGLQAIVTEAEKLLVKKNGGRKIIIESPRPLSSKNLEALQHSFSSKDRIETVLTPSLVAGVRVTIDGEWTIDATLKGKLQKLFVKN